MEIIEHGNTYRKMKCRNCHCVYYFTRKDLLIDGLETLTVCPECYTGVDVRWAEEVQKCKECKYSK